MPGSSLHVTPRQFIAQIVIVAIEEAFLLNEITEHKAIEHHRSVPLFVTVLGCLELIVNTGDEITEGGVLLAETGIEIFGQFLGVNLEGVIDTLTHIGDSDGVLLVDTECETIEFLIEQFRLVGSGVLNEYDITLLRFADRDSPHVVELLSLLFRKCKDTDI